jgi:hypothetical protein
MYSGSGPGAGFRPRAGLAGICDETDVQPGQALAFVLFEQYANLVGKIGPTSRVPLGFPAIGS